MAVSARRDGHCVANGAGLVDVELVPGVAVTRADRVGVMVVVPTFASCEERDPPVVAGVVLCLEATLAPEVSGGVHEPGGVEADGNAEEGCPENHADCADNIVAGAGEQAADDKLKDSGDDQRNPMVLAEP